MQMSRRLLHLLSYSVHIWNGFPGIVSAVVRSFLSLATGLTITPHMDRLLFPKGTERLDRGRHKAQLSDTLHAIDTLKLVIQY